MTRGVFASLAAVLLVPTCALAQRVLAPVVEGPAPVSGVAAVPLAGSLALAPSPLSISPSLAPPKVTTSGLLLGAARPLVNPARVPIAGLEGALRGLYESGRLAAAEPVEPSLPERPAEVRLEKPVERVVEARTEPAVPAPELTLREKTRKFLTITAGAALVVVGIVMIPLPGPGMLLVLVGLAMLAKYYPWAKQMLRSVKRKVVAATKSLRKYLRARRLAKIRERREKE